MLTALIDYKSGNLHSAVKAFEKIANENSLGSVKITSDPDIISNADRLVLPGDGAFPACKNALERSEVFEALKYAVCAKGTPFLGICVGMQLMATASQEYGRHLGLDWIAGDVVPLALDNPPLKIPHMGWNDLILHKPHPVIAGVENGDHVYFVHSYHFVVNDPENLIATADYGGRQTAIVARDNMIGTQFHPEKSQATGLRMIENFLSWRP